MKNIQAAADNGARTVIKKNQITWAKTEIVYPKNVGALVAMNFTS